MSARTEPRFTRDIDRVVDVPDDAATESLLRELGARGYPLVAAVEQLADSRLATARLASPAEPEGELIVDLLLARDDVSRPQDVADLRALCAVATTSDPVIARETATPISDRGFARGRDLVAALDELVIAP